MGMPKPCFRGSFRFTAAQGEYVPKAVAAMFSRGVTVEAN